MWLPCLNSLYLSGSLNKCVAMEMHESQLHFYLFLTQQVFLKLVTTERQCVSLILVHVLQLKLPSIQTDKFLKNYKKNSLLFLCDHACLHCHINEGRCIKLNLKDPEQVVSIDQFQIQQYLQKIFTVFVNSYQDVYHWMRRILSCLTPLQAIVVQ